MLERNLFMKKIEQNNFENNHDELKDLFKNNEPWSKAETKICLFSFIIAIVSLFVFGYLINIYVL